MIIRILRYILTRIFLRFFFHNLYKIDFINLINSFRAHLLSMSFRNIINLYWDLLSNRVSDNKILIYLPTIPEVNIHTLTDTK